jgi:formylglycine-generating enzyme required for sulfatase activity
MSEGVVGSHIGKYELLQLVEEGPLGRIWRARDTETGRAVLLKTVAPTVCQNPEFGRYFYEKWSDQQSLVEHPNVLRVWELGQADDVYFVAFEDVEGTRLSELLAQAPLPVDDALDIMHQIAEGLRAIHRRSVLHVHLKPSDIMVSRDPMGQRLVKTTIFDLGVSPTDGVVSVFGELLGAPKYMAPEVIQGKAPGPRSDVFALGVVGYELFTGSEPFHSDHAVGYLFANCNESAQPADRVHEAVPHEVALVVARMLESDPAKRYRSVERVVDDLDRCVEAIRAGRAELVPYGTDSAFARGYELPEPPAPRATGSRGVRTYVVAVAAVLVVVVGVAAYRLGARDAPRGGTERQGGTEPRQPEPPQGTAVTPAGEPTERVTEAADTSLTLAGLSPEQTARLALERAEADWRRHAAHNRYELGIAAFQAVADRHAGTPYALAAAERAASIYIEWAEALTAQEDHAGALEKYRSAVALVAPDSPFAQVARSRVPSAMAAVAEAARRRGDYAGARSVYEEIARDFPGTVEAQLLERWKPDLLLSEAAVLRDQGDYVGAREALLAVANGYAASEAAERARSALPDVYLLAAEQDLKAGRVQQARSQLRRLVEAYPEHSAAGRARELEAALLLQLYNEARSARRTADADAAFGGLLDLYPRSAATVEALRIQLALEPTPGDVALTSDMARSQLRKAEAYRSGEDFGNASGVLREILANDRSDSPAAAAAAALLPQWAYESALHSLGAGSGDLARTILKGLVADFPATQWARRAGTVLARLEDPPTGMVYVPEGQFGMGTDFEEVRKLITHHALTVLGGTEEEMRRVAEAFGFAAEVPRHKATTGAFFIDRTEVTNAAYREFVDATNAVPPAHWPEGKLPGAWEELPVVHVALADAQAYARWRGARLPTEAEWEKAARGTDGRVYPWGDYFQEGLAHHLRPESAGPGCVGFFTAGASPYGARDMIGNVMEWTVSSFEPYPGGDFPAGPGFEGYVVRRGGSWWREELAPIATRCASRYPADPAQCDKYTGFRCVVDAPVVEESAGASALP